MGKLFGTVENHFWFSACGQQWHTSKGYRPGKSSPLIDYYDEVWTADDVLVSSCPRATETPTGVVRAEGAGSYRTGRPTSEAVSDPTGGRTRTSPTGGRTRTKSYTEILIDEQSAGQTRTIRPSDTGGRTRSPTPVGITRITEPTGSFRVRDPDTITLPHEVVDDDSLQLPTIGQGGQMSPLMCGVKPDGRCTFLPLLSAGISSGIVTLAIATAASSTTLTMANAPLTFADVRVRGVVAYFHALGTATQIMLDAAVVSLIPQGGANCLYGEVPQGLEMTAIGTTAHTRILATRLRKSPMLRVNQTANVVLRLRNRIANAAAITASVTAYFIVDKVNDPDVDQTDCGCL